MWCCSSTQILTVWSSYSSWRIVSLEGRTELHLARAKSSRTSVKIPHTQAVRERICWFTDNQNIVSILLYGSKKPLLQKESLEIFQVGLVHQIKLEPEWVPRVDNQQADYWSKVRDHDDWMVRTSSCFCSTESHVGSTYNVSRDNNHSM